MNNRTMQSKGDRSPNMYKWIDLGILLISNIGIVVIAMLVMAATFRAFVWVTGTITPIIVGDLSRLYLLIFLPLITFVSGYIAGISQSLLVNRKINWKWALISGYFWFLAFIMSIPLFIGIDILEDRFKFGSLIPSIWIQLIGAALVGTLIGFRQAKHLHNNSYYERWWILINLASYMLGASVVYLFRIVQLH